MIHFPGRALTRCPADLNIRPCDNKVGTPTYISGISCLAMKKRTLEIALEKVPLFIDPDPALEQYRTPADIAADILFEAYAAGDIKNKTVIDLGCGTGMFSVGAKLMGAKKVNGYDLSETAVALAVNCSSHMSLDIDFDICDVEAVEDHADTVIMNPPFGCQTRKADRRFLEKALECGDCIYSVHMASTLDFVQEFVRERGRHAVSYKIYKYSIPHTFPFHKDSERIVDIVAVNIR